MTESGQPNTQKLIDDEGFYQNPDPPVSLERISWRIEFWCPNGYWVPFRDGEIRDGEYDSLEEADNAYAKAIEKCDHVRLVRVLEEVVDIYGKDAPPPPPGNTETYEHQGPDHNEPVE